MSVIVCARCQAQVDTDYHSDSAASGLCPKCEDKAPEATPDEIGEQIKGDIQDALFETSREVDIDIDAVVWTGKGTKRYAEVSGSMALRRARRDIYISFNARWDAEDWFFTVEDSPADHGDTDGILSYVLRCVLAEAP